MTQPNPMARQAELMELLARSAQGRTIYLDSETTGLAASKAVCAMQAFALHMGWWSAHRQAYRWHKLGVAATVAGHRWDGKAHRALADAMAARSVWRWLHEQIRTEVPTN